MIVKQYRKISAHILLIWLFSGIGFFFCFGFKRQWWWWRLSWVENYTKWGLSVSRGNIDYNPDIINFLLTLIYPFILLNPSSNPIAILALFIPFILVHFMPSNRSVEEAIVDILPITTTVELSNPLWGTFFVQSSLKRKTQYIIFCFNHNRTFWQYWLRYPTVLTEMSHWVKIKNLLWVVSGLCEL